MAWHRDHWWIWAVGLLVVGAVIGAFFVLPGDGDEQPQAFGQAPATAAAPETIQMPDVVGIGYGEAVGQLLDSGLFPNSWPVASTPASGNVVAQHPEPGATLAPGSTVRIEVSLSSGQPDDQVLDLTGLSLDDALRTCVEAGFTCSTVPAGGSGRVVTGERPAGGELAHIELSTG
jgi:hypothetical protein